ncbi:kinesin-like protein KIN-UA [Daucus carota subsp. sativus]|uniref:kinesin-like protein KIN-UA n=1 Tax=Daucus carota subsp. sativus TaxID=79200 RepID=UPI0007EFAA38|nr:PREDICTED: armadillo repeat-containing kinesin-like protein 3 [Daucus carota subsp. sativus]
MANTATNYRNYGSNNGTRSSLNSNKSSSSSSSFKSKASAANSVSSAPPPRRSSTGSVNALKYDPGVPGRVRVAVRLRPRNAEELASDADFADCVELQPELKRLKLRRNNWDSDTYEFDEVLTEFSSQKRVYEVVAKPVVESVLDGYNGTVMAYGQTGTGKTYTLGRLGDEDTAARGIMVRALEDILSEISPETDSVCVSYLQLYMETIQDLLDPSNDNISILEDPKTGDISLPGATHVEIRDQESFLELLRLGEAHRFAANTKLNTESSRSHAILMVQVKRSIKGRDSAVSNENGDKSHMHRTLKPGIVRKGKLVVVDLAGSERIDKSGSEGHTLEEAKSINLSLSALGKCINALAENSSHVPVRDSKLTRLLRDSFGGTARTSLVVTIGPSPRHRAETSSTISFGQRAMKVENMLKIKEEFDYKSLSRRLDIQLETLIAEHERRQKAFQDEVDRLSLEAQKRIDEAERNFADALEKERLKYQNDYVESIQKLKDQWVLHQENSGDGRGKASVISASEQVTEVKLLLEKEVSIRKRAEEELSNLKYQLMQRERSEAAGSSEILKLRKTLESETQQKEKLEEEIAILQNQLLQLSFEADKTRRQLDQNGDVEVPNGIDSPVSQARNQQLQESGHGEKASVAKLFEQVGLQKILSLLEAEDPDVRIHAVKVVANLAAEETNQEKIVEAGGLASLLMLLSNSDDETIHRVSAGAIANLAMNETNQELIMAQGGIGLLSIAAANAEDPQTLRMIAGAIANLCGNDKLQMKLRDEGGIRALLGMVRCRHPDVLAQVARGIANFAKCESRASTQGSKHGRSLLIEDGALAWIVQNANNDASPIRRHIELALCHLAQHEVNAKDMVIGGALWELVRISRECTREDIRILAHRTLTSSPIFQGELKRLRIGYN